MSELKEWIIALAIGGAIFFCTETCDDQSNESSEPVYTEWQPTSNTSSSYSQSTNNNTSNNYYSSSNQSYYQSSNQSSQQSYTQSYSESYNYGSSSNDDDYHDWDTEEIVGFYVKLDDCETDEEAEYISDYYYEGEYIEEGWDYYAKASLSSGLYEVELGDKVNSRFFKIDGSDYYVRFKWSTSLWKWDEGIMDVWNNKGTFYIKPD